jgi:hypothetical protein
MNYKIKKVLSTKQIAKKDGSGTFPKSQVLSENDEVFDVIGEVKEGDTLEGEVIDDPKWGKQLKKAGGNGGGFQRKSDPETQKQIMRQSMFKEANARGIAKSTLRAKFAKDDKELNKILEEELGGKHLLEVATYFAEFAENGYTPKPKEEPKEPKGTAVTGDKEMDEPPPEPKGEQEDLNLEDLPF